METLENANLNGTSQNSQPQNQKKSNKSQIIGVICVALTALLLVGGLLIIFIVNFNKIVPPPVKIFEVDGTFYAQAYANDNFYGYNFKFDDLVFSSDDALLVINDCQGIEVGKKYKVSVCYRGQVEGGNSEYSQPVDFEMSRHLGTPVVTVKSDRISWPKVAGAEGYNVAFSTGNINPKYIKNADFASESEIFVLFEDMPLGEYQVQVNAVSNETYLLPSKDVGRAQVVVKKFLTPFEQENVTLNGNVLTIKYPENLDLIEISIDGQIMQVKNFATIQREGMFVFTIDLTGVIGDALQIGARPASKNPYIVYSGGFTMIADA